MTTKRISYPAFTALFTLLLFVFLLPPARGENTDPGQQIVDAFNRGDYESTAKLAEQYIKDNSEADDLGSALYFSGISHFMLKKYPIAVYRLQGAADFKSSSTDAAKIATIESIKEAALYDLGRALIAYSENLNADMLKMDQDFRKDHPTKNLDKFVTGILSASDSEASLKELKDTILDKVLTTYDLLVKNYPNSLFIPDITQSRAIIHIQRKDYDQAEKDFEALSTMPSAASMKDDVDFRLGWLYGLRAEKLEADFEHEKAQEYISKARAIYERLSASDNLATANDSIFQLANLDFTSGKYESAIQRFHSVMPKASVIKAQNDRIAVLKEQIKNVQGDDKKLKQRELQHELDKLESIKTGSDLSVDALVRIGNAFLQNKKPDEARTIYRYSLQFAEGEVKKSITVEMIISYAIQGDADDAEKLFTDFKSKNPNDPMSEAINFYIGRALMQQAADPKTGTIDKDKVQQAIDRFNTNLTEFPSTRVAPEIIKLIGQCYQMLGQPEKAVEIYNKFIDDVKSGKVKVAPEAFEDAQRLMAEALFNLKKYDDAVKIMGELRTSAKTPEIQESAYFRYAFFLQKMDKKEEAAKAIDEFVAKYPTSQNASKAFYTRAQILYAMTKGDAAKVEPAVQAFKDVYTKYPDDKVAMLSYDAVWKIYRTAKLFDKMKEAQDLFLEKFPFAPETVDILVNRAKEILTKPDKAPETETDRIALEDKAIEAYTKALDVYSQATKTTGVIVSTQLKESAASAQLAIGDIHARRERAMGAYISMTDDDKKKWEDESNKALEGYKSAVRLAPATNSSATALSKMNDVIKEQLGFQKIDLDKGLEIFISLASEPGIVQNLAAKNQIRISSAALPYDLGMKERSTKIYEDVFKNADATTPIKWEDLDRYGSILIDLKKYDEALKIYLRLKDDFGKYKAADGTMKDNPHVLATVSSGLAIIYINLGKTAEAEPYFKDLEKNYQWSPKYVEAMLFQAEGLYKAKKIDEALKKLVDVTEFPKSAKDVQARALFRLGEILLEQTDSYNGPILKQANGQLRTDKYGKPMTATVMAYNYFCQVELFYGDALPELTGQSLIKAAGIALQGSWPDHNADAKKLLLKITTRYSTTSSLSKAREMLSSLP